LIEKSVAIMGGYTTSDWNAPDPEANPTILNGLSQGRVMVISGTLDVSLYGLHLVYGSAEGLGGYPVCYSEHDAGGGVYIRNATVTIDQTWIMTNTTPDNGFGGGIYAVGADISMTNGTAIQANYGGAGGGLYLNHTHASLEQAAVLDNHAGGP